MKTTASRCCEFQAAPCEISTIKLLNLVLAIPYLTMLVSVLKEKSEKGFSQFSYKCWYRACKVIVFQISFEAFEILQSLFLNVGCSLAASSESREVAFKVAHQVCAKPVRLRILKLASDFERVLWYHRNEER